MFVVHRDALDNFNQSIFDGQLIQCESDEFKQFIDWLVELFINSSFEGENHG